MLLAQRLPVVLVPEQTRITTVRHDVVNHGSLHVPRRVFFQALRTKRVLLKEQSACLLPSPAVATLRCRASYLRVKRQMLITIDLVTGNKLRASRMSTGFPLFVWHRFSLPFFFSVSNQLSDFHRSLFLKMNSENKTANCHAWGYQYITVRRNTWRLVDDFSRIFFGFRCFTNSGSPDPTPGLLFPRKLRLSEVSVG